MSRQEQHIPDAGTFQIWLKCALEILDVTPHFLGKQSGVSVNAIGKFVSGANVGREIHLTTASKVCRKAQEISKAKGKKLPGFKDDLPKIHSDLVAERIERQRSK